ncbi:MAG: FAD-linked oxidase C-terminal domain-containing protein [Planctomycetota bacterium]
MIPLSEFAQIVGAEHVLHTREETFVYECDGLTHARSRPAAVVLPRTTDEVSRLVKVLVRERIPFVARGAGTGLSGGALCPHGGVTIETARMNRVLEVDAFNRFARVECGVSNAAVSVAALSSGLHFAPDPSSQIVCTIGGNVAENAGGPHCFKYGATVRHVLALKAVLPDGEIVELGSPLADEPGLDLVSLLVGSEGTCAVVTEATLLLTPLPEKVETLLVAFPDVARACEAVCRTIASGLEPATMEILDRLTIEAVEASVFAAGYPQEAGAVLLLEFDGQKEQVLEATDRTEELCRQLDALSIERARDQAHRLRLWKGRKGAFGAMGRLAPDLYVQDAVVPRSRLPEVLAKVIEIGREAGIRLTNILHAGDGNLHPNVSYDRRDLEETGRVIEAGGKILKVCIDAGGSLSGEHGIGVEKRDYMRLVFSEDDLDKMRAVRDAFNRDSLLNPNKVLPESHGCARGEVGSAPEGETLPS